MTASIDLRCAFDTDDRVERQQQFDRLEGVAAAWLNERRPDAAPVRRPLHWPLAFPEVFNSNAAGFCAIVGNPPFQGGKKISTINGGDYEALLKLQLNNVRGAADLSAHFLRRSFTLMRPGGVFGLLSTDRIAEGDTEVIGLRAIRALGGAIIRARRRFPWPGTAATWVAMTHVIRGTWRSGCFLDGRFCRYDHFNARGRITRNR